VTVVPVRWLTVFLDFPAGSFGAGVAFWAEVTGSTLSPFRGAAGEFATLLPADGMGKAMCLVPCCSMAGALAVWTSSASTSRRVSSSASARSGPR
jgi:hypothetical protein